MSKKHILIGVSGGIAAYKACDLVSRLSKGPYEIKVIMTEHAQEFVSKLTFETLSHNPCEVDLFSENNEDPIAHISLAKWADVFVIVPATANVIAKMVHGIADDLLSTTALACTCPKIICPAMNVHMYENPVTQNNLVQAAHLGFTIVEPVTGHLACNDTGKGKLASVDTIYEVIQNIVSPYQILQGKHVLISAGPTQEALDPVRFLTNHSSGKQGYAIAKVAQRLGAKVTLVSGPCALQPDPSWNYIPVTTSQDMYETMLQQQSQADYIIMSAAVSDYRPSIVSEQKIKKSEESLTLTLTKNPDILAHLGKIKRDDQVLCGFAMETENMLKNAQEKLVRKNCDILVANHLFTEGAGFQGDTNVVTVLRQNQEPLALPLSTKEDVAYTLLTTMKEIEEGKKDASSN